MRDLRIYLEKLGKSLIRRGYEIPEIKDFSEDGLFRYAKFLDGVLYFINYVDFYGEMHKQFYEEFVRERDDSLRAKAERESVDDVFDVVEEVSETEWQEATEETEEAEVVGYSADNPFLAMLSANSHNQESQRVVKQPENVEVGGQWADEDDLDAPHPVEEAEDGFVWEDEDGLDAPHPVEGSESIWADEDDLDAPHPVEDFDDSEIDEDSGGIWADEDDLDAPNTSFDEDETEEDAFSIDNSLIEEVSSPIDPSRKEEENKTGEVKEERKPSDAILKSNQTIDMLGSWLGGTKKKGRKRND